MYQLMPSALERWYSRYGAHSRYDLSSSAAPALSTEDLLELAGETARAEYLALDLNYTSSHDADRLRQVIASQYATLDGDNIQLTTGAAEGIFLLISALVRPGDTLVVQFPIYPAFYTLATALGAKIRRWPFRAGQRLDLELLATLLQREQVRAIVLNHPHSPTGHLLSAQQLEQLSALASAHQALLIVDEVYRGIQFVDAELPAAADLGRHAVSIGDLSKPYGLGGLRIGWIATANSALLERCAQLRDYTSLCNSAPSQYLAILALDHRAHILERHLATARKNRRAFVEALSCAPWIDYQLEAGGFTIFPRLQLPLPTARISLELCQDYQVLVLPGEVFDQPGYLRIGFGVEPVEFSAGLERLTAYAHDLWRGARL